MVETTLDVNLHKQYISVLSYVRNKLEE